MQGLSDPEEIVNARDHGAESDGFDATHSPMAAALPTVPSVSVSPGALSALLTLQSNNYRVPSFHDNSIL